MHGIKTQEHEYRLEGWNRVICDFFSHIDNVSPLTPILKQWTEDNCEPFKIPNWHCKGMVLL